MTSTCAQCGAVNRAVASFCVQCSASLPTQAFIREAGEDAAVATLAYDAAGPFTRTRMEPGPHVRPAASEHALPTGTLIEGFRIERVIGEGGFGIVYLAWDAALERQVAIKEYMPFALASRADSLFDVSVRSERNRDTFEAGLKSFVNEARLLARFDHPALLKVLRFWTGNRTAYMAMPYYEGPTLKAALTARSPVRPTEAQLREWLDPLLDALAVIHAAQCYHRDISPDNILLTHAGPLLLDFGAARRVITDMTQAFTAVLKPGFAPIEQYGGVMSQGPWTDLYALAGVVHYAITGRPPEASVARVVEDSLKPLATTHAGQYSDAFLRAIDAALAIRPEARPQDVQAFRALLDAGAEPLASPTAPTPNRAAVPVATAALPREPLPPVAAPRVPAAEPVAAPRLRRVVPAAIAAVLLSLGAAAWWWQARPAPSPAPAAAAAPDTARSATAPPVETRAPVVALPSAVVPPTPPAPTPPAPAPTVSASVASPAPARPKPVPARPAVTEVRPQIVAEREAAPVRASSAKPARCAEIVQKSTLESLNPEEIAYLKRACR